MNELTAFVQEAATGQRPTHFYYKRGKLLGFNSKQAGLALGTPHRPDPRRQRAGQRRHDGRKTR
jgi:hypothetical protein